jgi:transposase
MESIPKYTVTHGHHVGLDVHKETIAIDYGLAGGREDATYHGHASGHRFHDQGPPKACEKTQSLLPAGSTSFVIARDLIKKSFECVLMLPSKTERKPADKIKTDKRDACKITRLFRNGDITQVSTFMC